MFLALDAVVSRLPPDAVNPSIMDALATQLINSAFLTPPSQEWFEGLRTILVAMPPDTQQRWSEYVKQRRAIVRNSASCVSCRAYGSPGMVFAAGEASRCPACATARKVPIDLLADAGLTTARDRQIAGLSRNDNTELRLREDFAVLCSVADQIDVIDPYVVTDAIRAGMNAGLTRFLSMADEQGVGRIRLLTGVGGQINRHILTPTEIVTAAAAIAKSAAVSSAEIHVVVVDKQTRKRLMHDRFLGFYWGSTGQLSWTLGKGLSQYSGSRARTHHAVSRLADGFVSGSATVLDTKAVLTARVV